MRHIPRDHDSIKAPSWLLLVSASFALTACSPDKSLYPEERALAKTAFESCLICHSTKEMQRGPIIDGLPAWYSRNQLSMFLSGVRGQNPDNRSEFLMGSTRDRYAGQAIIDLLARYIEELPAKPYHPLVRGDAEKGKTHYQSCIPCHGAKGEGVETLNSPPLDIQEDWYLLDQLRKFASRKRGYHFEDIYGMQMAYTVNALSDQDLKDVIVYIQTFANVEK